MKDVQDDLMWYDMARQAFDGPDAPADIQAAVDETLDWLHRNKMSIDVHGLGVEKPWFDTAAFGGAYPAAPEGMDATDFQAMVRQARCDLLDAKVYEHGLARLLHQMEERDYLTFHAGVMTDNPKLMTFIRSGEVKGWIRTLVRYSWAGLSMNQGEFIETGDYLPDTPSAHVRKKLEMLAQLGLVTVEKPGKAFAITAGPIAKAFYEQIWHPTCQAFEAKVAPLETSADTPKTGAAA